MNQEYPRTRGIFRRSPFPGGTIPPYWTLICPPPPFHDMFKASMPFSSGPFLSRQVWLASLRSFLRRFPCETGLLPSACVLGLPPLLRQSRIVFCAGPPPAVFLFRIFSRSLGNRPSLEAVFLVAYVNRPPRVLLLLIVARSPRRCRAGDAVFFRGSSSPDCESIFLFRQIPF